MADFCRMGSAARQSVRPRHRTFAARNGPSGERQTWRWNSSRPDQTPPNATGLHCSPVKAHGDSVESPRFTLDDRLNADVVGDREVVGWRDDYWAGLTHSPQGRMFMRMFMKMFRICPTN